MSRLFSSWPMVSKGRSLISIDVISSPPLLLASSAGSGSCMSFPACVSGSEDSAFPLLSNTVYPTVSSSSFISVPTSTSTSSSNWIPPPEATSSPLLPGIKDARLSRDSFANPAFTFFSAAKVTRPCNPTLPSDGGTPWSAVSFEERGGPNFCPNPSPVDFRSQFFTLANTGSTSKLSPWSFCKPEFPIIIPSSGSWSETVIPRLWETWLSSFGFNAPCSQRTSSLELSTTISFSWPISSSRDSCLLKRYIVSSEVSRTAWGAGMFWEVGRLLKWSWFAFEGSSNASRSPSLAVGCLWDVFTFFSVVSTEFEFCSLKTSELTSSCVSTRTALTSPGTPDMSTTSTTSPSSVSLACPVVSSTTPTSSPITTFSEVLSVSINLSTQTAPSSSGTVKVSSSKMSCLCCVWCLVSTSAVVGNLDLPSRSLSGNKWSADSVSIDSPPVPKSLGVTSEMSPSERCRRLFGMLKFGRGVYKMSDEILRRPREPLRVPDW